MGTQDGADTREEGTVGGGKTETQALEEKAYAAGIVDGEGTIGLYGKTCTNLTLKVEMKAFETVDWLRYTFNGTSSVMYTRPGVYRVSWRGTPLLHLLNSLLPHLKEKKAQALQALRLLSIRQTVPHSGRGHHRLYRGYARRIASRLKSLKQ